MKKFFSMIKSMFSKKEPVVTPTNVTTFTSGSSAEVTWLRPPVEVIPPVEAEVAPEVVNIAEGYPAGESKATLKTKAPQKPRKLTKKQVSHFTRQYRGYRKEDGTWYDDNSNMIDDVVMLVILNQLMTNDSGYIESDSPCCGGNCGCSDNSTPSDSGLNSYDSNSDSTSDNSSDSVSSDPVSSSSDSSSSSSSSYDSGSSSSSSYDSSSSSSYDSSSSSSYDSSSSSSYDSGSSSF